MTEEQVTYAIEKAEGVNENETADEKRTEQSEGSDESSSDEEDSEDSDEESDDAEKVRNKFNLHICPSGMLSYRFVLPHASNSQNELSVHCIRCVMATIVDIINNGSKQGNSLSAAARRRHAGPHETSAGGTASDEPGEIRRDK